MSSAEALRRIELREGTGEPSVLELNTGEQMGPIDVGTMGHWRISADGVAERHAFLFFDGTRLFLQSVDVETPVMANGRVVPAEWTAVEPPCEVALGKALLWFYLPGDDRLEEEEVIDEDTDNDPGAVETRVVPIEQIMERTAATRRAVLAQLLPVRSPTPVSGIPHLPPMIDRSERDDMETATSILGLNDARAPGADYDAFSTSIPTPTAPAPRSQRGFEMPPPSGAGRPSPFAPTDPAARQPTPPSGTDHLPPFGLDEPSIGKSVEAAARPSFWARMSFPQKATAILFLPMLASVVVLFTDVVPPTTAQRPSTSSSTAPPAASSPAARSTAAPPSPPAPKPSPLSTENKPAAKTQPTPTPPVSIAEGPPPEDERGKTMQRQAVDALARGANEEAARLYETLAKKHPENKAYAAAAAITRANMAKK